MVGGVSSVAVVLECGRGVWISPGVCEGRGCVGRVMVLVMMGVVRWGRGGRVGVVDV